MHTMRPLHLPPIEFRTYSFLLALFLEQRSEDRIGNTKHSDNKAVLEPPVSPAFAITYFCNHCNTRFENTSKYVDTLTLFSKNLNQRSLTPRWPLTPCLLRSHVWLYPRIIVSKSHDNTSMYVDTVTNFAKYHIHTHTTYILHTTYRMSDHIVSYWTQFRRDIHVNAESNSK